ncbi:MAG: hypothetical protein BHV94_07510 [Clostridiales bacterium 59_14]|nr:MAG: hypothetical protein BHV94_07510 [Clostridiales bacterium 59_14]
MSKIVLYPANGYDFDAADVAAYLAGLTSGVFSSAADFPVTAAGGLKVTVGAGRGWVHPSRFTGYSITKREADTLTMPLADPSLPRIDRIVMRYDAGARAASLQVLQGTASSTPTAPAISRTELIYDLCLAEITRPAGSTSITTGQITDTRLDEALCGLVRDGVTGIPTDELLAAARERINALEEKATSSAAAAKDSAEAAKSSETKSAASEKAAKTSETAAKQALQDTETEHTTALQDITQARTAALNDVAASTKTATAAANTATQQATAAAGSASTASTKAGEASTSAGEASASRQAAEKAQKAAEDAAELAGTRAGTDKTLNTENAPADAAAVGKAFASIIKAYDIALAAASWKATSDTAAKNAGWAYQCDATVSGCTAALEPSATISLESVVVAQKAGLGSICSTDVGFCRFYAEKVPTADISLRLLLTNKNPV